MITRSIQPTICVQTVLKQNDKKLAYMKMFAGFYFVCTICNFIL